MLWMAAATGHRTAQYRHRWLRRRAPGMVAEVAQRLIIRVAGESGKGWRS
jgi:hypothetical protein